MALVPTALASSLETQWLRPPGAEYPGTVTESGDSFAGAVASWFAAATAGAFPCATAMARRSQLAGTAAAALQVGNASLAGTQLALAVAGYMAGQSFGAGVASAPVAVSAGQSAFGSVFANLDMPNSARANTIAGAIHAMALSTVVVFPPVVSPPTPIS